MSDDEDSQMFEFDYDQDSQMTNGNDDDDFKMTQVTHLSDEQKNEIDFLKRLFIDYSVNIPTSADPISVYINYYRRAMEEPCLLISEELEYNILKNVFFTSKYTFFTVQDEDFWNRLSENILPSNHPFYHNFTLFERFLSTTGIDKFTNYCIKILDIERYWELDDDLLQDMIDFFKANPDFIEGIPDSVYRSMKEIMRNISSIPPEERDEKEANWVELFQITGLDQVSNERLIVGVKWMVVMNTNKTHAMAIIRTLAKDELVELNSDLDPIDVIKSLYEYRDQDRVVSAQILLNFADTAILEYAPAFYNIFINYIKENPNTILDIFFRTFRFVQKVLDCENIFPKIRRSNINRISLTDVDQFKSGFEINQNFLKYLVRYEEAFHKVFFEQVSELFLSYAELSQEGGEVRRQRIYDFSKSYFITQVQEFIVTKRDDGLKIDFDYYLSLRDQVPILKQYHDMITKNSILEFLNRVEPNRDVIEAWEEMWRLQNGDDEQAPPPPEWFIRQNDSSNVHNKSIIKTTDCRLKLLRDNHKENLETIDDIIEEIERETREVATINAQTEFKSGTNIPLSDEEKMEYIIKNTVTRPELLRCRVDEQSPRYYGFGEIYDQELAERLAPENRVELCRVVVEIWLVIRSTKNQETVYRTLISQFTGIFKEHLNNRPCNQGWVGSLTSVFASLADDLGYLCQKVDPDVNEKVLELEEKFLMEKAGWPTILNMYNEITQIMYTAYYEDTWSEKFDEEEKMADSEFMKIKIQEKRKSFEEKLNMFKIVFEPEDDVDLQTRRMTAIEYINLMKPSYFMDVFTWFNENAPNNQKVEVIDIKKALIRAFSVFTERNLKSII